MFTLLKTHCVTLLLILALSLFGEKSSGQSAALVIKEGAVPLHQAKGVWIGNSLFILSYPVALELIHYDLAKQTAVKTVSLSQLMAASALSELVEFSKKKPILNSYEFASIQNNLLIIATFSIYSGDDESGQLRYYPVYFLLDSNFKLLQSRWLNYSPSNPDPIYPNYEQSSNLAGIVGDTVVFNHHPVIHGQYGLGNLDSAYRLSAYRLSNHQLVPLRGLWKIHRRTLEDRFRGEAQLIPFNTNSWKDVRYLSEGNLIWNYLSEFQQFKPITNDASFLHERFSTFIYNDTLLIGKSASGPKERRNSFEIGTHQFDSLINIHLNFHPDPVLVDYFYQDRLVKTVPWKALPESWKPWFTSTGNTYNQANGRFYSFRIKNNAYQLFTIKAN